MKKVALSVTLKAKPGKEEEVATFLAGAQSSRRPGGRNDYLVCLPARSADVWNSSTASAATRPARRTFKALSPPPCSAGPRNCSTGGRTSVPSIFWPKSCLHERRAPRPRDACDENSTKADAESALGFGLREPLEDAEQRLDDLVDLGSRDDQRRGRAMTSPVVRMSRPFSNAARKAVKARRVASPGMASSSIAPFETTMSMALAPYGRLGRVSVSTALSHLAARIFEGPVRAQTAVAARHVWNALSRERGACGEM